MENFKILIMVLKKAFLLVSFILLGLAGLAQIKVVELKCEYLKDPQGIDMSDPRFYWKLRSEETGQFQTGYRVIVFVQQREYRKEPWGYV